MTAAGVLEGVAARDDIDDDVDVAAMSDDELVAWSRSVEADNRRGAGRQARALREIEQRQVFRFDGHRDVRAWARATHRWSSAEANAMRRLSRLVAAAPAVGDALDDGTLGVGQAQLIARAYANPRCADLLLDQVPQLLQHAANESAARFERIVLDWIELVDQDGGFDARQRAHDDRSMSLGDSEHTFMLRVFGDAIDGEELRQGFKRYLDAEWKAEWADCVAEQRACQVVCVSGRGGLLEVGVDAVGVGEGELLESLFPVRGELAFDEPAGCLSLVAG